MGRIGKAGGMITVVLDWPHPALAPNRNNGRHWAEMAAIRAKAKQDAYWLTRKSSDVSLLDERQHPVTLTFVAPDKRRRDLDGCLSSMKPALDGVAQALGLDDSQFRPITLDYVHGDKPGSVIVTVGS